MFLPIGHEHTTVRRLPWVTFSLMAICAVLCFVTTHVLDPEVVFPLWGVVPADTGPVPLFTYMFLHAGWAHLFANLLILLLAGPPLEDRWGRPLFAGFYLSAGLASGLFYALMTPDSTVPMVGASGAIAGAMGACLFRYWQSKIHFRWFMVLLPFRVVTGTFWAPAWAMLPLWFASEVFMAALTDHMGASSGVAYWAHVGGFAFGFGFAWLMKRFQIEERFIDSAIEEKITVVENPVIEEAMAARMSGDPDGAWMLLQRAVEEQPDHTDLVFAWWEIACELGRPEQAAPALLRILSRELRDGDQQLAARSWCDLCERAPAVRAEPAFLVRLAPLLLARAQTQSAIRALRQAVEPGQRELTPGLALQVIEAARPLDAGVALAAAQRVLESPDLHEAKRAKLEALVAELEEEGATPAAPEPLPEAEPEEVRASRAIDLPEEEQPPPLPVAAGAALEEQELDASGGLVAGTAGDLAAASEEEEPAHTPGPGAEPGAAAEGVATGVEPIPPLKVVEVVPLGLEQDALLIERSGGVRSRFAYEKIDAVAVAVVLGLAERPVLLVDLMLNWSELEGGPLKLVRLRSDRFDVRDLAPSAERPADAFRILAEQLLARSGAAALPDRDAARGQPFRRYDDLDTYQRDVLGVAA